MQRILSILLLTTALPALATEYVQSRGSDTPAQPPSRGWYFFQSPPEPEEASQPEQQAAPTPSHQAEKPKEDPCAKKETWSASCGFVNPKGDYAFQAKQRDALFEQMVVSNNDPKAVEGVQRYMQWAMDQSQNVTRVWQYNMMQNPELDPSARAPVSTMGLRLLTNIRENDAKEYFNLIKSEGGGFVYFSRSDCEACHQMSYTAKSLEASTGIKVVNVTLDNQCDSSFTECTKGPAAMEVATALNITVVPTIILHLPENTWIRVANGVSDAESIKERTVQFFQAYRNAIVTGTKNGEGTRPSVNFNTRDSSVLTSTSVPTVDEKQLGEIFKRVAQ